MVPGDLSYFLQGEHLSLETHRVGVLGVEIMAQGSPRKLGIDPLGTVGCVSQGSARVCLNSSLMPAHAQIPPQNPLILGLC